MDRIIDIHTHAFPDALADRAMAQLLSETDEVTAYLDGRVGSLLESMDRAGIEISVVCCIATKPGQFEPILDWCRDVASERIIPFPSVHPADPEAVKRIERIKRAGFKGVKMHPYYQDFVIADPACENLYKSIIENDLILVLHTGYDVAFERVERASPTQILHILDQHEDLKLITTHMGGWFQWDQVEKYLLGRPIYMETSVSLEYLGPEKMKKMLEKHDPDYLLFGTDSPWDDQSNSVKSFYNMGISETQRVRLFYENAQKLLGL